jgi:hypothetical protein
MGARPTINGQRRASKQLGEFAGSTAPHQVHLEESFLGMDVTQGPCHISPILAADGDRTEGVALDGHRKGKRGNLQRAIERWQASSQKQPGAKADANYGNQRQDNEFPNKSDQISFSAMRR